MPIGTLVSSHTMKGGRASSTTPGVSIELLCDGGSRPNPGTALPLVVDANGPLSVPPSHPGTNHQAIYDAVDWALDHAAALGAEDVTIELVSKLVWGQLTGSHGCRRLLGRRDATLQRAQRFPNVSWTLVDGPFSVAPTSAKSIGKLRRRAVSAHGSAGSGGGAGSGGPGPTDGANLPVGSVPSQGVNFAPGTSSPVPAPPGP